MKYIIKAVEKFNGWSNVEKANIDKFVWLKDYCPVCYAQAVYVEGEELKVRLTCVEKNPKAAHEGFYSHVYKDSCLEFFFSFDDGKTYVNAEMNSKGSCLIGYGAGRHGRTRIDELAPIPEVKAEIGEESWSVELTLPDTTIEKVFGVKPAVGTVIKGNFYKCGDETEVEHYGMWSPVGTEKPDFHRPEYFGEMVLEK